ncbi:hypothetical protein ACLB1G_16140 [Oxalobacteraceae bacterium A2-2]
MSTALQFKVATVVGYVVLATVVVVLLADQAEVLAPASIVMPRLP